jgi:antitoxin YefM
MLVEPLSEEDETTYLLKSEINKKYLLKALENVEKGKLIFANLDEYEKIVFESQTYEIEED